MCALQSGDLTNTFSFSGAWLETVIALAAVASYCVDTTPVLTDARLGAALVQVFRAKDEGMKRETRVIYLQ